MFETCFITCLSRWIFPWHFTRLCILKLFNGVFYKCQVCHLVDDVVEVFYILTDFLFVLTIIERGLLKTSTIIMDLSIFLSVLSVFTSIILKVSY